MSGPCDGDRVEQRLSTPKAENLIRPPGFYEPTMAYRRDKDEGDRPIRLTEEKDLWRDSSALFQFDAGQQFLRPLCFMQLHTLVRDKIIRRSAQRFDFATLGLCNRQGESRVLASRTSAAANSVSRRQRISRTT